MNIHQPRAETPLEEVDLFEMANLYPRRTGLPMTVWVSPRGLARHDARVKVCRTHGDRMDASDTASVSVRPAPELVAGDLSSSDLRAVQTWISLNADALIRYWDGEIDTLDLGEALKKL